MKHALIIYIALFLLSFSIVRAEVTDMPTQSCSSDNDCKTPPNACHEKQGKCVDKAWTGYGHCQYEKKEDCCLSDAQCHADRCKKGVCANNKCQATGAVVYTCESGNNCCPSICDNPPDTDCGYAEFLHDLTSGEMVTTRLCNMHRPPPLPSDECEVDAHCPYGNNCIGCKCVPSTTTTTSPTLGSVATSLCGNGQIDPPDEECEKTEDCKLRAPSMTNPICNQQCKCIEGQTDTEGGFSHLFDMVEELEEEWSTESPDNLNDKENKPQFRLFGKAYEGTNNFQSAVTIIAIFFILLIVWFAWRKSR